MPISDIVYLNHAGTSWPKPDDVQAAVQTAASASPADWPALIERAAATVAEFFHVDASRLLFTPGCTSAIRTAVMDLPWATGDCVVTSHFEHHALQRCLTALETQGVTVVTLPPDERELIDLQALESILEQQRVRLLALSAACNVTGQLLPVEQAISLARRYDTLTLVDGAQTAGWRHLQLRELDVDLFTFAGHKGLQAPWGIGGLYVSERTRMACPQAVCSIAATQDSARLPGYCDVGSLNVTALCGLAAGCRWLSATRQRDRLQQAQDLAGQLSDALRSHAGLTLHHDTSPDRKMPTVAVSVAGQSSTGLAEHLRERAVIVSGGYQCAPRTHEALGTEDHGVLRFSFGPQSTVADVERAAQAFADVLGS